MAAVVADTHAIIWYLLNDSRLSANAEAQIDAAVNSGGTVHVCSISFVEIIYLVEKGRVPQRALALLQENLEDTDSAFVTEPLSMGVAAAVQKIARASVPDLPDRVIAATALHLGLPLVTRDSGLRQVRIETIW